MKTNSICLSGVATAALLSGFIATTPALAQYDGNPPQYSSPAERAQTQQLNEQNIGGTTQSPAELNGDPARVSASGYGGYDDSQSAPDYQQQQYDQQGQQYRDRREQYLSERDRYDRERNDYRRSMRRYDQIRWDYNFPHPYADDYYDPRLQRLDLVWAPRRQLWNVPVQGRHGMWVGRIREVDRAVDGKLLRIEISLNRRVSVWVRPWNLRFDPDDHVAYTNLSRDDLWNMPGQIRTYPM